MFRRLAFVSFSLAVAQLACSGDHPSKSEDGMVKLTVATVPSDVQCLVLTAVGGNTTAVRPFSVSPGQPANLAGTGLPTGTVTLSEVAYNLPCSSVASSSPPTWVSNGSVTVQLVPGQSVPIAIELVRPGQATITNTFTDGTPFDGGVYDAGVTNDSGVTVDSAVSEAGAGDTAIAVDGGVKTDVPVAWDGGVTTDVPVALDSGASDSQIVIDGPTSTDSPIAVDGGITTDVPVAMDSNPTVDTARDTLPPNTDSSTPVVIGCSNPITFTGGQTGNFNTTDAVCYRTTAAIAGWGCSNFDGRTLSVDNVATACGAALPARWSDGYYYFAISAGTYSYASIFYW